VNIHQMQNNWITGVFVFATVLTLVVVNGFSARAHAQSAPSATKLEAKAATDQTNFYCNLKALTPQERERLHQLTEKLKAARMETKELADGYAFRLQPEEISMTDLAEYVTSERKCCPFFDFEIALQRGGGPLWLRLRGQEGVKVFMRHEFGIQ
jgi:hypothetical protein